METGETVKKEFRILILEDNADDAEFAERELRKGNVDFSSKVIATREAFLEGLETFSPDLFLSDCTLPGFDGLSALAIARERRPGVPFIFFSGTMNDELAVESLKQGATDYILKDRRRRLAPAVKRALREVETRSKQTRTIQALRESEAHYRMLVEGVSDYSIYMLDRAGRISSWNAGAERLFGFGPEEILGQHFSCFFSNEESLRDRPEQVLQRAMEQGRVEEEALRLRKHGAPFWANVITTALRDRAGRIRGSLPSASRPPTRCGASTSGNPFFCAPRRSRFIQPIRRRSSATPG